MKPITETNLYYLDFYRILTIMNDCKCIYTFAINDSEDFNTKFLDSLNTVFKNFYDVLFSSVKKSTLKYLNTNFPTLSTFWKTDIINVEITTDDHDFSKIFSYNSGFGDSIPTMNEDNGIEIVRTLSIKPDHCFYNINLVLTNNEINKMKLLSLDEYTKFIKMIDKVVSNG